jgi:hypothetical protein
MLQTVYFLRNGADEHFFISLLPHLKVMAAVLAHPVLEGPLTHHSSRPSYRIIEPA